MPACDLVGPALASNGFIFAILLFFLTSEFKSVSIGSLLCYFLQVGKYVIGDKIYLAFVL